MLRPVFLALTGLATTSCGLVESDPRRFESMAQAVADIPLDGEPRLIPTASESGLRPAIVSAEAVASPGRLRVEVMDPHDLWDARDAGLRGAVEQATPAMIEAAGPAIAAAARSVALRPAAPTVEPALVVRTVAAPAAPGAPEPATLQLGAFSSPAAARAAWTKIAAAGDAVAALSPLFEVVDVDGRTLTRLKVVAPADAARAVCRAADAARLGCLRRG
jgi:hypothetical protein